MQPLDCKAKSGSLSILLIDTLLKLAVFVLRCFWWLRFENLGVVQDTSSN